MKLREQLVVVVQSEMGRTPTYNNGNGKDHWSIGSIMFLGPGITGNRVIGATDEKQFGVAVDPEIDVVMLSGQDKIEVAVKTMQYGAFDYIVKGESSFYRAEKAVFNIYRFKKLQGNASAYKRLSIGLAIGFGILAVLITYLQMSGSIKDLPGWL